MQVVYTPVHMAHAPETEVNHGQIVGMFELPRRVEEIRRVLLADPRFTFVEPTSYGLEPIEAVHDAGLVSFLESAWKEIVAVDPSMRQAMADTYLSDKLRHGMGDGPETANIFGRLGFWGVDTATPITEGTYGAARGAVDVALTATDLVLGGEPVAYGLCRPPGHHAPRAAFAGYCYFNNAAIAAERIAATGVRVTVLDVDYHHGNGTQQIFYDRPDVQYVSLHGDPMRAYPYFIGFAEEIGAGAGRGTNLNLPLAAGSDNDAYASALARALESIDRFDPAVVVVSLGVDTYVGDPISDFRLTTESFTQQGALVAALGRPMVVIQEGGYDIDAIGANVSAFLDGCHHR